MHKQPLRVWLESAGRAQVGEVLRVTVHAEALEAISPQMQVTVPSTLLYAGPLNLQVETDAGITEVAVLSVVPLEPGYADLPTVSLVAQEAQAEASKRIFVFPGKTTFAR
jgi:hypothetical protein